MRISTSSLRYKIFMSMIILTILASVLILVVTISQYKEEAKDYHIKRLYRKEVAVKSHINSILNKTTYEINTKKLPYIFGVNLNDNANNKLIELSRVHKMPINIYDLEGNLIMSSRMFFKNETLNDSLQHISNNIIHQIDKNPKKRYVIKHNSDEAEYQSSFSYIYDRHFKPIAILNLPYLQDSTFYKKELEEFLINLGTIYLLLILLAIAISYWLSRYITRSLNSVNRMLQQTSLSHKNQKIIIENPNDEIDQLIESYNKMVDKLEVSAKKLAQTEKEEAWRNMARQVAHEIKNPLTPMRLNIQSFQMSFDPKDPNIKEKFMDFGQMLIEQIDIMSKIATAFSDFAKMPKAQLLEGELVEVISNAIKIYNPDEVKFISNKEKIFFNFDKSQMQRMITNLIKNALQSVPNDRNPDLLVSIKASVDKIFITISDNGSGIPEQNRDLIFEPKFTTKSSGMGLGLAIVKRIVENHKGKIWFDSVTGEGTTFYIEFSLIDN